MSVLSLAVGLVILPLAFVLVPVRMLEDTTTIGLVIVPLAHVVVAIWPYLATEALSDTLFTEIATILDSIAKIHLISKFETIVLRLGLPLFELGPLRIVHLKE